VNWGGQQRQSKHNKHWGCSKTPFVARVTPSIDPSRSLNPQPEHRSELVMKSLLKTILLVVLAVGLIAGLVIAFIAGHKEAGAEAEREKPVKAPTRVEMVNGENVVAFDHDARASGGVTVAPLQSVTHRHEISAYSTVLDLQELTDLRNAIASARAQQSKSQSAREVADADYQRVKSLYDKNQNVSQKVVQAAEGTLQAERSNLLAAQAAFHAVQATALQHWGRVIADWLTGPSSTQLEQLRSQKNLLVQVTLAPGQGNVAAPPTASVQNAEGQLIPATFVSLAPRTDPKIQGKSFLYMVAGEGANLLPGMNVTSLLPAGESKPGVIVPASAVVWLQGKPWVYVELKPDHFARREVSTAQPVPAGWFQAQDFSAGQTVVVKGSQVLLSEEFRAQISVGEEGK
jgi:hypothetical protein